MMTSEYRYIFGPVPSRRLGTSLGVDLTPPKTCSLDCVYCECGKTTHLTLKRQEYVPTVDVMAELKDILSADPPLDYITFSGSGEPTLHSHIGEVLSFLKKDYPQYKTALLTNSTLLHQARTRDEIRGLDMVMASLDAADEAIFKKINRPCPGLDHHTLIEGIDALRKILTGELWIEIFLVPGVNTDPSALGALKQATASIGPHGVYVNALDRPGTLDWVQPVAENILTEIRDFFHARSLGDYKKSIPDPMTGRIRDLQGIISRTTKRRPLTAGDIAQMTGIQRQKVDSCLNQMVLEKRLNRISMPRGIFYHSR